MKIPVALLILIPALLLSNPAFAEKMAGLQTKISGDIEGPVKSDVEVAIKDGFKGTSWQLIDTHTARKTLASGVRDCFTADCLKKAGKSTKSKAGIRIKFTGEAQIYDWTLETYDLRSGKKLATKKGACELCGRAEVKRTFQKSVTSVLNATKLSKSKSPPAVVATPEPEPEPEPEPVPPPAAFSGVQLVKINIQVEPPDASVTFRDAEVGRGVADLEVGPGNHEITIKAEGYLTLKELVVVDDSTSPTVGLRIHLQKKNDPPEAVAVNGGGAVDKIGDKLMWGLITAGTGVVFLGIGAYLTGIDGEMACDSGSFSECPEVYRTGGWGFVTTMTGAVLLTGGAILMTWDLLAGEVSSVQDTDIKVAPSVGSDSAGISLFGRF